MEILQNFHSLWIIIIALKVLCYLNLKKNQRRQIIARRNMKIDNRKRFYFFKRRGISLKHRSKLSMKSFKNIIKIPKIMKQTIQFSFKLHLQGYFIKKTITMNQDYKKNNAIHKHSPLKNHLQVNVMTHSIAKAKMKVKDKN